MEAQRFPKDYDGIVAGAPANFWTSLLTNGVWNDQALTETPDSWISPEKLSVVTNAALKVCHGEDGVVDDPGQCNFDPSSLLCTAGESNECLSAPQIAALKKLYSGRQDASGKSIFPGYPPGGESDPVGWVLWITGVEPKRIEQTLTYGFVTGYFATMVFDKPDWSFRGQNPADDLAQAQEKTGRAVDAADPDLSAFRDAGGKLLQYHGWNDPRSRRRLRSTITRRLRPSSAGLRKSSPSIGCSWPRACSTAAWASAQTRSAACTACLRQVATPRMTSLRPWRIGSKMARRRSRSSRRFIMTTTRPRESRRNVRGAPIRRPLDFPARAPEPRPPATPARRRRSERQRRGRRLRRRATRPLRQRTEELLHPRRRRLARRPIAALVE